MPMAILVGMASHPADTVSDTFLGQISNATGASLPVVVGLAVDSGSGQLTLSPVGAPDVSLPFSDFDRGYGSVQGVAATPAQPVAVRRTSGLREGALHEDVAVFFGDSRGRRARVTLDRDHLAEFVARARSVAGPAAATHQSGGLSL